MKITGIIQNTLTQISTMKSLKAGYFDGVCNAGDLKQFGDTGIGTFEGVEGELIMTGGVVYRALYSDRIETADDSDRIPYALTAFLNAGTKIPLSGVSGSDGLKKLLAGKTDQNSFYLITINGLFGNITVRSLEKSSKPYPTLEKATEKQYTYNFSNIKGTAVGFYCPAVTGEATLNDWHFHFISADRKHGGHILDMDITDACANVVKKEVFTIIHPETSE